MVASYGQVESDEGILPVEEPRRIHRGLAKRSRMDPDKAEYRISEAARIKAVQRSTVWRAIDSGELAAHTEMVSAARAVWLIRRQDLEAWHPVVSPAERGRMGAARRYGKGDEEKGDEE